MTPYTDEELEKLLTDLESDLVERKRSDADGRGIRKNICAFANDLPGRQRPGVIFIGAENDGRPAGILVTDQLLRNLAQMRDDGNILLPPVMVVEKRLFRGVEMAVVLVDPSRYPPVRYRSRVWVKVGPTVRLATDEEERGLRERRRAADLPFDMQPASGATLAELDLDYLRSQYLPRAVAPEVLEENRRLLEEQLRSLRLVLDGTPCHGALLGFTRDPQPWLPGAYVQFLRIDGRAVTDAIRDQKMLAGRLEDILRRVDELLELNVSVRTDLTGAPREIQRPDYPLPALQQLVRNAIMHRTYEGTNAPVRLYWFADRVEIQNPGGLYGQVNPENFGKGATDYRNPLVAEIMHHLGFAQRFGVGVPIARKELERNGNPPPEFEFQPSCVNVTVRPAP